MVQRTVREAHHPAARLAVLRGLLAAAATASKTEVPVNTDSRVLVLLKKQAKASQAAAKDFDAANRAELKAKEEAQLAILNGYIDAIPTVSDNEVSRAVTEILSNLKANGRQYVSTVSTFQAYETLVGRKACGGSDQISGRSSRLRGKLLI